MLSVLRRPGAFNRILHLRTFSTRRCLLAPYTVKVPQMAESISEGTLRTWSKRVGESVAMDEEVATIETDKIDVTVNSPQAGTILEFLADEDATVAVGQDLFIIETDDGASPKKQDTPANPDPAKPPKQDVEKTEPPTPATPPPPPPPPSKPEPKKVEEPVAAQVPKPGNRGETRVKMPRIRLRIAERLLEAQHTTASLTTFNEIDMSSLISLRASSKESVLANHGVKLGFMGAFARACALVLKEIPAANAYIDGEDIVYRDYVDLSVAVATPKGLVTPVVRGVESMGIVEIEKEIATFGKKARDGKLALEDITGGSFTISNGGVFGSLYGTPIINPPQAAVLGMHSIKDRPVVVNGQIVIRPIMIVALTYDHRIMDGREAVTFLVKLRDYIEDPRKMLLA